MSLADFTERLQVREKRLQESIYVSSIGRFAQPDSLIPGFANPQNLNRYTYVLNSPMNFTDSTGHFCEGGYVTDTGYCVNSSTASSEITKAYDYVPPPTTCDDPANTHLPGCQKDPAPLPGDPKDKGGGEEARGSEATSPISQCLTGYSVSGWIPFGVPGAQLGGQFGSYELGPDYYSSLIGVPLPWKIPYTYTTNPAGALAPSSYNGVAGVFAGYNTAVNIFGVPYQNDNAFSVTVGYSTGSSGDIYLDTVTLANVSGFDGVLAGVSVSQNGYTTPLGNTLIDYQEVITMNVDNSPVLSMSDYNLITISLESSGYYDAYGNPTFAFGFGSLAIP
ncbi:MAG: hypothetical protein HYZ26_06145 [Chloroflexi bacterium]|nr:hypothetical protein [Chloroflexota bacterium]